MKKSIYNVLLLTAFSIIGNFSIMAQEVEPNNTFTTASEIRDGIAIDGFIQETRDVDVYRYNATEPGILNVRVFNVPSGIDIDIRVFDPFQELYFGKVDNSNGVAYAIEGSTCEVGTHYIQINDGSSGSNQGTSFDPNNPYRLLLTFTPFSEIDTTECINNSTRSGFIMDSRSTVSGTINPPFKFPLGAFPNNVTIDRDNYFFRVSNPGEYSVELSKVPFDFPLDMKIFSPLDDLIADNHDSRNGENYKIYFSACDTGLYYVSIYAGLQNSSVYSLSYDYESPYNITLDYTPFSEQDGCECESDNDFSSSCFIAFGDTIFSIINAPFSYTDISSSTIAERDADFYSFQVTTPGIVTFSSDISIDDYMDFTIYSDSGEPLSIRSLSFLTNETLYSQSFCEPGTYYVAISDLTPRFNLYELDRSYSLNLQFFPFSGLDECECSNETPAEACAVTLCEPVLANAGPLYAFTTSPPRIEFDVDYFEFDALAGDTLFFQVSNVGPSVALELELFNPLGQSFRTYTSRLGEPITFYAVPSSSGRYQLKISAISNVAARQNETSTYTLSICNSLVSSTSNALDTPKVALFPNPANDVLNLNIYNPSDYLNYKIVDVTGRILLAGEMESPINVSSLPEGVYTIIFNGKEVIAKPFVVKR